MEDPVAEIPHIIHSLTSTTSVAHQSHILDQYFLPDAGFDHPFCRVDGFAVGSEGGGGGHGEARNGALKMLKKKKKQGTSRLESRELIKGVYQWYKMLSPVDRLRVNSVAFDDRHHLSNVTSTSSQGELDATESLSRLYVDCTHVFTFWFLPWHSVEAGLVTLLFLKSKDEPELGSEPEPEPGPGTEPEPVPVVGEQQQSSQSSGARLVTRYYIAKQVDLYPLEQAFSFLVFLPGASFITLFAKRVTALMCFLGSLIGCSIGLHPPVAEGRCNACLDMKERQTREAYGLEKSQSQDQKQRDDALGGGYTGGRRCKEDDLRLREMLY